MSTIWGVKMSIIQAVVCISTVCSPTPVIIRDGDTIVVNQVAYRLKGINTPEISGKCENNKEHEIDLAFQAKDYLTMLLSSGDVHIYRDGYDRYRRVLADVVVNGENVGDRLIKQGLARKWTKKWSKQPEPWCK
ncbi:thermonuclease family protein [Rhizobium sp. MHM7A]|nr:thermonuclease family protein [Rhizobium sp. MHM7A]